MKQWLELVAVRYDKDMHPLEIVHSPELNLIKSKINVPVAIWLATREEVQEIKDLIRNRAVKQLNGKL